VRVCLHELDALTSGWPGEGYSQALGVEAERHVDRVRLEDKVVLVGDQRDLRTLAGKSAQVEGGLESAEATAKDDDAGRGATTRTGASPLTRQPTCGARPPAMTF
jgi:hypothetical protein